MTTAIHLAFEPEDAAAAASVAAALTRAAFSVQPPETERASDEHLNLLAADAAAMVLLLSAASAEETKRRVHAAWNNGRALIVVRLGDVGAESWLAQALTLEPSIDARAGLSEARLDEIVEAVRTAVSGGRVVALLNIKGGVGKTVLAANLFAAAHLIDQRSICFVDLDPQHNLTQYFLPPGERSRVRATGATIFAALTASGEASRPLAQIVADAVPLNRSTRGKRPPFALIPGDERLFEFTLDTRSEADKFAAFLRFRALIAALRQRVDAVVIDANPCATFLTRLAVSAADHIVAPVRPETYSLTGLNMLEHVVRAVRGRPLRAGEFSVLLNGVNDRTRSESNGDPDALTRAEIAQAPFFGATLLEEAVPYSGALRSTPADRYAANPINVTAMMRVGGRQVKEALAHAAAAVLRRARAT